MSDERRAMLLDAACAPHATRELEATRAGVIIFAFEPPHDFHFAS